MSDTEDCLTQHAFDVEVPDNFDPSIVPSDGLTYLQKVKYEATQCPDIVVADPIRLKVTNNIPSQIGNYSEHRRVPAVMMLTLEEQNEEAAKFSSVRQKVAREIAKTPNRKQQHDLPRDLKSWHKFCFGDSSGVPDTDGLQEGVPPLFSILVSLSQCEILELLDYHVEFLESQPVLTKQQAVWLYSLLVFTEVPLLPDTCSTLRTLARTCSRIRETLESIHDEQLPPLNLFICLVARYFNQIDLGDDPLRAGDM